MIRMEVCINSDTIENAAEAAEAAYRGGASTIELCSAMEHDGLTPPADHIRAVRHAFRDRPGLMVMIRPRAGDFIYTRGETDEMLRAMDMAAHAGADGAVFGILRKDTGLPAPDELERLVRGAAQNGLLTTFHRAFDAAPDPIEALEIIIGCGINRVLTSGTPWDRKGTALDGIETLHSLILRAGNRIEIVVSGGITPAIAREVIRRLPADKGIISMHAYSGARVEGKTSQKAVQMLVDSVNTP